jgi:hypothetical protein
MSREEQLKLEHSTLMEQYKSARDEIESLLDASRQVVNLTLTVISLILGASVFIETKLPIAFLILPLFLYGLVWIQLRHILLMRRASAYIAEAIAPRVRSIMKEIFPEKAIETEHILDWEEKWQSPGRRKGGVLLLPVLGANYGLPLFAAVLFLVVYIFSVSVVSVAGWMLIGINLLALIYSIVLGFLVEFRRFGQDFQSAKSKESQG